MHLFPHMNPFFFKTTLGIQLVLFLFVILGYFYTSFFKLLIDNMGIMIINLRKKYTKYDNADVFFINIALFMFIGGYTIVLGVFPIFAIPQFTFVLMIFIFTILIYKAFQMKGIKVLKSFVPSGIPKALIPFIYCLELISFFIKPIVLMVRLSLSFSIGHLLVDLLASMVKNYYVFNFFLSCLKLFELATISLQVYLLLNTLTYVYGLLTNDH